jgi:uncharacterized membrane-anchored protein
MIQRRWQATLITDNFACPGERRLSIHAITTSRFEAFYRLTILFIFAFGRSAGDLVADSVDVGYCPRRCCSPS